MWHCPDVRANGRFILFLLAAGLLAAGMTGCLAGTEYDPALFSPDGSTVIRVREDATVVGPDFEAPTFSAYNIFLDIVPVAQPGRKWAVKIYSSLKHELVIFDKVFSPDSSKVAIVGSRRLVVVDLKSAEVREIARTKSNRLGVDIISAGWAGNDEICYVVSTAPIGWTHVSTREDWYKSTLAVYRQGVAQPQKERKTIYEKVYDPPADYSPGRPTLEWSPDGRTALFADPPGSGPLTLLDIRSGKRRALAEEMKSPWVIAWRPDGGAALCYGGIMGSQPPRILWLMVHTDGRPVDDLSGRFRQALPDDLHSMAASWTPDGKHVLVGGIGKEDRKQYYLIRPRPWQVIPVSELLAGKIRLSKHEVPRFDLAAVQPLATCSLAGWLVAYAEDSKCYLTDYHARRLHQIPGPVISPDGKRVATYNPKSPHLNIRELKLPKE